ncbi:MAG: helix-turn-helix domain-containing protein [Alphaproteobacteria bacterium]|nr:helix-turn-helix domain-containing protein [Alphaproteobacteria bacterium]
MSGVGTRIKRAREALGMTQVVLAKSVGVSQQAVMELESGRAKGTKHTAKFARALGQDAMWIELGEGRMREPGKAARVAKKAIDKPRVPIPPDNYERIPVFDIRTNSKGGALAHDAEPIAYAIFALDWLRDLTRTHVSKLAVMQVAGDSMEPTLCNGDRVLVDMAQKSLRREGVYVIGVEDTLIVRRVTMHPRSKRVALRSDNPRYETYNDLDPDRLNVAGRVIWIGRTLG